MFHTSILLTHNSPRIISCLHIFIYKSRISMQNGLRSFDIRQSYKREDRNASRYLACCVEVITRRKGVKHSGISEQLVVLNAQDLTFGLLTHELLHAVSNITKDTKFSSKKTKEECQCQLLEFLTDVCIELACIDREENVWKTESESEKRFIDGSNDLDDLHSKFAENVKLTPSETFDYFGFNK